MFILYDGKAYPVDGVSIQKEVRSKGPTGLLNVSLRLSNAGAIERASAKQPTIFVDVCERTISAFYSPLDINVGELRFLYPVSPSDAAEITNEFCWSMVEE